MAEGRRLSSTFGSKLVILNESISPENLAILQLAARYLEGISQQALEKATLMTDVYRLIEERRPDIALPLLIWILSHLCVSKQFLDDLRQHCNGVEIRVEDHKAIDFVLAVSCTLRDLVVRKYLSLKEIARRTFLDHYDSSNITSRTHLIQLLLDNSSIDSNNFNFLFAWLEVIGCTVHQCRLRQYCNRHGIQEPEWKHLVPCLKESFSSDILEVSMSLTHPPPTESSLSPFHNSLPNLSTHRDDQRRPTDLPVQSQVSPFQGHGRTSDIESPAIHYHPQQPVERETGTVVIAVNNQKFPVNIVPGGGQTARGTDGAGTDNSTQFPLDEVVADHANSQLPLPVTEEGDDRSLSTVCDPSPTTPLLSPSSNSRYDTVPFQPRPDGLSKVAVYSGENSINKCSFIRNHWKKLVVAALIVSFFVLLPLTGYTGWLVYDFSGGFPAAAQFNASFGANATVKIGQNCFSRLHVRSIRVSSVTSPDDQQYSTDLYLVSSTDIIPVSLHLPDTVAPFDETLGDENIGMNYYSDDPVYTAGPGTLFYQLRFHETAAHHTLTVAAVCQLRVYLFDSSYYYGEFLNQDFSAVVMGYIDSWSPCNDELVHLQVDFQFSLPCEGFYFVGLAIKDGASFNATISAKLQAYDVLRFTPQRCHISSETSSCPLEISDQKIPSLSEEMCLLMSSSDDFLRNVTVSSKGVIFNRKTVISLAFFGFLLLVDFAILVTLGTLGLCYCLRRCCHRQRKSGFLRQP